MKPWDSFVDAATKQYGGSSIPKAPTSSTGSTPKQGTFGYDPNAGSPKTHAELYKNASPYMRQVAAGWDDSMRVEEHK